MACVAALVASSQLFAAGALDAALAAYESEVAVFGEINSEGDGSMARLMLAWMSEFQRKQPGIRRGQRWEHVSGATAFGALMFEIADLAPLAREPLASELAPYAHQFAGDMMKSPLLVRVARAAGMHVYIAVNKRPGSPLPPKVKEFLAFVISRDGQTSWLSSVRLTFE